MCISSSTQHNPHTVRGISFPQSPVILCHSPWLDPDLPCLEHSPNGCPPAGIPVGGFAASQLPSQDPHQHFEAVQEKEHILMMKSRARQGRPTGLISHLIPCKKGFGGTATGPTWPVGVWLGENNHGVPEWEAGKNKISSSVKPLPYNCQGKSKVTRRVF